MKITKSRIYSDACADFGEDVFNYKNMDISFSDPSHYSISKYIGKGRYSMVFIGKYENEDPVVIKSLRPVPQYKIFRELAMLTHVSHPNIIKLIDITIDRLHEYPSLIFEYMRYEPTREVLMKSSLNDMRVYMYQLLSALNFAHSRGIMHRDLKPHNIIINPVTKMIKIIDWGLADFYLPKKKFNCKVGTRYYKAIELLVGYPYYDYSVDIWSAGLIFFEGCVNSSRPFFSGTSDDNQVDRIVKFLGSEDFLKYLRGYRIDYKRRRMFSNRYFDKSKFYIKLAGDDDPLDAKHAVDLVSKLVVYDHQLRFTAQEALMHPFFTLSNYDK